MGLSKNRRFTGTVASLAESRAFIRQFLNEINGELNGEIGGGIGWQARTIDIQLAIGEAMQNIIRYGFDGGIEGGQIDMYLGVDGDGLECVITDNAAPSNPQTWRDKATARHRLEGGRGQAIIEALATVYQVESKPDGNRTRLVFASVTSVPDTSISGTSVPDTSVAGTGTG